ncbi:MAG TPA: ectonucleotide pyrophosphatase/phosphodiesterase [Gemmatimonadales bacterium]|nr:ectonucleotide pyrophosphatase/phosphodiesterase [Gemmatimonadales bacterium]
MRLRLLVCSLLVSIFPAGPGPGLGRAQQPSPDHAVILVGLDGFHPSYLDRAPSQHLRRLAQGGVRAKWMIPVFPTLTFPNFYSMVTGLYPEHHGIVSNTMKDPVLGRFALRDTAAVRDPRWWGGEPIWATVVKQGKRAATYFWPGSEAPIGGVWPSYYQLFDSRIPNADRVRQVLAWLSLPADSAPSLITLYLGDVDDAGHEFGPKSSETDSAIGRVDRAVGQLLRGLEQRGLEQRVNIVVVSDHGMAEMKADQVIYLDDYVDSAAVDIIDLGPVISLSPRAGEDGEVFRKLQKAHPRLRVYRKAEIPARYHYRAHIRIPAIVGVADEGWTVTTRARAFRSGSRLPRGHHGYPPDVPSMRAVFLARGPAFAKGTVVEPFENIQVYSLLAHILGLQPAPNNGSLNSIKSVLSQ